MSMAPPPPDHEASAATGKGFGDLPTRIVSGLVLGTIGLALAAWGVTPFALFVAIVALAMSWEWGRMVRHRDGDTLLIAHVAAVATAIALTLTGYSLFAVVALAIGAVVAMVLSAQAEKLYSALGVLYVGLPCVALVWFRGDGGLGLLAVLFMLAVAWTTDTAAFLAGRLLGGPKLWPAVSPNKTWSGFLAGVLAAGVVTTLFASFAGGSAWRLALIGILLAVVAQAGDLFESALKRLFGVKDASGLIPGHGGALDRMDSIAAVAVVAALFAALTKPQSPAMALLIGN